MKKQHDGSWMICAFTAWLVLALAGPAAAATYTNHPGIPAWATTNWMSAGTWTPAGGPPGSSDTVDLIPKAWPNGFTLQLDAGWGADTVNVRANDGNDHVISVNTPGTIRVLNWNGQTTWYSFRLDVNSTTLTLTELHDIGPYGIRAWGSLNGRWLFSGDAVIEYNTCTNNSVGPFPGGPRYNVYAGKIDFSAATSLHLYRSAASASLDHEYIRTWGNNEVALITLGRADNGTQVWTVDAGSHPALFPGGTSQDAAFAKVGTGDVIMPDVDLIKSMTMAHGADDGGAISDNGQLGGLGGGMYQGTVYANSLTLLPSAGSTAARRFDVLGHLVLDGQGGLQAGGTGNSRAVSAVAGDTNLEFKVSTGSSSIAVGQVEITPTGGDFYLGSVGAGLAKLNINNNSRDVKTYTNRVALIANSIVLDPRAYISDRNDWADAGYSGADPETQAGGIIEFRGNFVNQSTRTNEWRTDHATIRDIGGGTFEAASQDLGTGAPALNAFQWGNLTLGLDHNSTTGMVTTYLTDTYDNFTGAGGSEAVYVDTLQLYGNSILDLRGLNLYFRNGSGNWVSAMTWTNQLFTFANGGDGTGLILNTPEPSILLLLAAGLATLRWSGRRRA